MFFGAGEKVVREHGLEEGGEIGFAAEGPSTMGFAGPPLLVVVLLMEPKSRRFELLQLEFDSGRATVADVLSQIPVSANDERLKGQKYTGVASTDGKAKRPPIMLADFCSDNEVIVAVPSGMMATSVARLAQPILGNAQVMDLLNPKEMVSERVRLSTLGLGFRNQSLIVGSASPARGGGRSNMEEIKEEGAPVMTDAERIRLSTLGIGFRPKSIKGAAPAMEEIMEDVADMTDAERIRLSTLGIGFRPKSIKGAAPSMEEIMEDVADMTDDQRVRLSTLGIGFRPKSVRAPPRRPMDSKGRPVTRKRSPARKSPAREAEGVRLSKLGIGFRPKSIKAPAPRMENRALSPPPSDRVRLSTLGIGFRPKSIKPNMSSRARSPARPGLGDSRARSPGRPGLAPADMGADMGNDKSMGSERFMAPPPRMSSRTRSPARPGLSPADIPSADAGNMSDAERIRLSTLGIGFRPKSVKAPPQAMEEIMEDGGSNMMASYEPSTMGFTGPPLQVIILLMEPKTRRFELLQLEFDSGKATVATLLSQITLSAKEDKLKKQKYSGVAARNGIPKKPSVLLAAFCSDNEVLIAVPKGMMWATVAKNAQPILSNPQVMDLVSPQAMADERVRLSTLGLGFQNKSLIVGSASPLRDGAGSDMKDPAPAKSVAVKKSMVGDMDAGSGALASLLERSPESSYGAEDEGVDAGLRELPDPGGLQSPPQTVRMSVEMPPHAHSPAESIIFDAMKKMEEIDSSAGELSVGDAAMMYGDEEEGMMKRYEKPTPKWAQPKSPKKEAEVGFVRPSRQRAPPPVWRKEEKSYIWKLCCFPLLLIIVLLVFPLGFGLGFGLRARRNRDTVGDDPVTQLIVGLSSNGGDALEDPDSPQRAALDWLLSDPLVANYTHLVIEQRYALATLYESTDGDNWRINTGWLDQEVSECEWEGIFCENEVVEEVVLFDFNLAGTIPPEAFLLTDTREFILYDNALTGTIPEEVADMTALLELELDGNDLTGTIPEGIFTLTGLTKVQLADNDLTGTLSSSVGNLTSCEEFRVDSNDMSGPIPEFLTFMSSLNELRLNGNGFTGTIPASLGGLSSLDELTLQDNDLVGEMPDEICDLDALVLEADCGGAEPEVECSARCCTECFPQ